MIPGRPSQKAVQFFLKPLRTVPKKSGTKKKYILVWHYCLLFFCTVRSGFIKNCTALWYGPSRRVGIRNYAFKPDQNAHFGLALGSAFFCTVRSGFRKNCTAFWHGRSRGDGIRKYAFKPDQNVHFGPMAFPAEDGIVGGKSTSNPRCPWNLCAVAVSDVRFASGSFVKVSLSSGTRPTAPGDMSTRQARRTATTTTAKTRPSAMKACVWTTTQIRPLSTMGASHPRRAHSNSTYTRRKARRGLPWNMQRGDPRNSLPRKRKHSVSSRSRTLVMAPPGVLPPARYGTPVHWADARVCCQNQWTRPGPC